jgi:hypothetical protein
MKRDPIVGIYTEDELRKAAWIIGPHGAAARALADAERRRSEGEDVAFYRTRSNCILVGPNVDAIMELVAPRATDGAGELLGDASNTDWHKGNPMTDTLNHAIPEPSEWAMNEAKRLQYDDKQPTWALVPRYDIARALDAAKAAGEARATNPCAKIFDHKWLDPACVESGCKSLLSYTDGVAYRDGVAAGRAEMQALLVSRFHKMFAESYAEALLKQVALPIDDTEEPTP